MEDCAKEGRDSSQRIRLATTLFLILQLHLTSCLLVHAQQTTLDQHSIHTDSMGTPRLPDKNSFCAHDDIATICLACAEEPEGALLGECCSQGVIFQSCTDRLYMQLIAPAGEFQGSLGDPRRRAAVAASLYGMRGPQKKVNLGNGIYGIDEELNGEMSDVEEGLVKEEEEKKGKKSFPGKASESVSRKAP